MRMKNKPTIVIRADGGDYIGMGHLVRTGSLAEELNKFVNIIYICNEEYKKGISYLEEQGYHVLSYRKDKLLDKLLNIEAHMVITDHYGIDDEYISKVRKKFKVVGYIDDTAEKKFKSDFILNQNYGAQNLAYQQVNSEKLFLGAQYLLLRKEFRLSQPITIKKKAKNVLVTVGGSDNFNITGSILERVKMLPYHFHVVIGNIFPYQEELVKTYSVCENIKFYHQPKMVDLMSRCDVAISSCGSTLYELGVMGIPTIGLIVADNQKQLAENIAKDKGIVLLGECTEERLNDLGIHIEELMTSYDKRYNLKNRVCTLFDKNGVEKVAQSILAFLG